MPVSLCDRIYCVPYTIALYCVYVILMASGYVLDLTCVLYNIVSVNYVIIMPAVSSRKCACDAYLKSLIDDAHIY